MANCFFLTRMLTLFLPPFHSQMNSLTRNASRSSAGAHLSPHPDLLAFTPFPLPGSPTSAVSLAGILPFSLSLLALWPLLTVPLR